MEQMCVSLGTGGWPLRSHDKAQSFDVPGVTEYTVASNMVRNRVFYSEI